mgnify:FL=1
MGTSLVFPAPKDTYTPEWMEGKLKYYTKPKQRSQEQESTSPFPFLCYGSRKSSGKIPYLYLKHDFGYNKRRHLIIYFHGNSELLSEAYATLEKYHNILDVIICLYSFSNYLFQMDVIAPEYPGYGLYNDEDPSEKMIVEDAFLILKHCIEELKYSQENIILIGRSLGTGVAVQMNPLFPKIKAIILISAFLSVRYVGENVAGRTLSKFLPNVFRNEDFIETVTAPVLFIHGMKDTLVPWTASQSLYTKCKAPKMLCVSATMEHNNMDYKNDIFIPIMKFFDEKLGMNEFGKMAEGDEDKLRMLTEMDDFPYMAFPEYETKNSARSTPRLRIKFSDSVVATAGDDY